MGGGMLTEECKACGGDGIAVIRDSRTTVSKKETVPKIDKRSKAYKESIKRLMDAGLDKETAEKEFEQEYYNGV